MNDEIDLVLPCLIPNSEWYDAYSKVKGDEHPGRVRDLDILRYTLRSYEKNISWIRKIFIILYDETQIPEWLNTKHPKIEIVFHKDFIPKKHLPNFNSVLTGMYCHLIKGLSEKYIYASDDMIYLKKINPDFYFFENKTVHHPTKKIVKNYNMLTKAQFGKIERNNYEFLNKYVSDGNKYHFWTYHLPIPLKKTFVEFMWDKFNNEFDNALNDSKIRADKNISNWLFYNFEEFFNLTYNKKIYDACPSTLFHLTDRTTENDIRNVLKKHFIVAINDGDKLNSNFEKIKKNTIKILQEYFPNKSSYEV